VALDYFTLAELRAFPDLSDAGKYPDARCTAVGEYVQAVIEGACGTSFVPRSVTETLDGDGTCSLRLSTPYIRAITSVTIEGVLSTDTFTATHGILERTTTGSYWPLSWTQGRRNVTVVYTAGYSTTPPADIKEAALQATRARLMSTSERSSIDDRRTSISNEMGVVSFVIAGDERPTGYPEVDAVINRWAKKLNTVTYP
jgi:hypothetical protein